MMSLSEKQAEEMLNLVPLELARSYRDHARKRLSELDEELGHVQYAIKVWEATADTMEKIIKFKLAKEDKPKPRHGIQKPKVQRDKTKYRRKAKHRVRA